MTNKVKAAIALFFFSLIYINSFSNPVWLPSAVTISAATGSQGTYYPPAIVSDGDGGAIFAWIDNRLGNLDLYAGRVDASGNTIIPGWTADGIAVCNASGIQQNAAACSDGSGGIIVVWADMRGGNQDIYAQRINSAGMALWQTDGVPVCVDSRGQSFPAIASDGAGGAIVVWQDGRNNGDLYAQRITAAGSAAWAANGIPVCAAAGVVDWHTAVSAPGGGVYAVWQDKRSDANGDVYAQYIDSSGIAQWAADGIPVVSGAGPHIMSFSLAVDASGNLIVPVAVGDRTIVIQKVSQAGNMMFAPGGTTVTTSATAYCTDVFCAPSQSGSVILAWTDDSAGPGMYDMYSQKMDSTGNKMWNTGGVLLSSLAGQQSTMHVAADIAGGAIVSFFDNTSSDVYLQRIDVNGVIQWGANGIKTNSSGNFSIVSDGSVGVIAGWGGGAGNDFFAQRYSDGAAVPTATPTATATMVPVIAPGWVDIDGVGTESISVTNLLGLTNTVKIAVDNSGRPNLLFQQNPGSGQRLYFLKWNGSGWVDADGTGTESMLLSNSQTPSYDPSLVLDSAGNPHVSWLRGDIYYMKWAGSNWVDADGSGAEAIKVTSTVNYATSKPKLALAPDNIPHLAWIEYIEVVEGDPYHLKWSGSSWVDADGIGQESSAVSTTVDVNSDYADIAIDANGNPHIVWWEFSTNKLQYLKWNGSEWVDADGIGRESGNVAISTGSVTGPCIKIDAAGEAHVTWRRGTAPNQIYYLRTSSGAWVDADGSGTESSLILSHSTNLSSPIMAVDGLNRPHISFNAIDGGDLDICYLRWNGSAWTDIDGAGTEAMVVYNNGGAAYYPNMKLDMSGTAHVAWHDNETGVMMYLKYPGAGEAYPTVTPTLTHTAVPSHTKTPTMTQTPQLTFTNTSTVTPSPTGTPTVIFCTSGKTTTAGVYSGHSAGYTAGSVFVFPAGNITEIRLAMENTAGTITAAIYDNSGVNGTAGNLIISAGSVSAFAGWNSIPIAGSISVPGTYWIMIQYDGLNQYDIQPGVAGSGCFASVGSYGTWPASLSASGPTDYQVGVYAVMTGCGVVPSITATWSCTPSATVTMTAIPITTATHTPQPLNFELLTSEDPAFTSPEPARIIMYFNYRLEMDADPIVIDVYNFAGKRVATVTERNVLAGIRRIEMNVERFAPGVYYYVISADYTDGTKVKFKPAKFMVAR